MQGMRTTVVGMIIAALGLLVVPPLGASDLDAVDGPNVRVMRLADGSKCVYTRSPDQKVVTKKTYSGAGRLTLVTIYRLDGNGNPMAGEIFDGQKNRLFKVDYGYRKQDGQLVMERMWDCRVRRVWKDRPDEEMPVQVVQYLIDGQGKASKPIVTRYLEGKTFEQVYGSPSAAMDPKMFDEQKPSGKGGKPASRR